LVLVVLVQIQMALLEVQVAIPYLAQSHQMVVEAAVQLA
jgi:hypothetical protein